MEIPITFNISSEMITRNMKFHAETNKDQTSCYLLSELETLLDDIMFDLTQIEQSTLEHDPNNKSGKEIRYQINKIYETLDKWHYEREEDDQQ